MKRLCILIGVVFLFISALAFADTSTLIDFTQLAADVSLSGEATPTENEATLVDFSGVAGSSFDEQLRKQMKTSLAIENWEVQLSSSSRTVANQSKSFTREAMTRPDSADFQGETMSGITVMGVRVHFPLPSFNSFAIIKPPFEIPAYAMKTELQADGELADVEGDLGTKFEGYGVIKNVGVIKSVEITVYGSNFPNGIGLILKDQDEVEQNIFMDYLEFDGWKTLVWNNPNYIAEVRNREIRKYPLYPKSEPFTKLVGLILYRDSMQEGGDIITYLKDIKVTYDKAVLRPERDIDDEAIWGILSERQEARKAAELRRLGNLQVLRFLEQQKMHEEETE